MKLRMYPIKFKLKTMSRITAIWPRMAFQSYYKSMFFKKLKFSIFFISFRLQEIESKLDTLKGKEALVLTQVTQVKETFYKRIKVIICFSSG